MEQKLESTAVSQLAEVLLKARKSRTSVPYLSLTQKMTPMDAYAVQEEQLKRNLAEGEKQIGWKMGLTSEAKRKQMNLFSPLYGFLTDVMQVKGDTFSMAKNIHPKIEPEIAFLIGKDLRGEVSREQVLDACDAVAAAMEILDTRYEAFKYFSLEDVIADNSSSSYFVVGPWRKDFRTLDLLNLKMDFQVNGQTVHTALSKEISGDPVRSVQQLCELLAQRGQYLKAGSLVLAGAATPAVELKPGLDVQLHVTNLEPVRVRIGE